MSDVPLLNFGVLMCTWFSALIEEKWGKAESTFQAADGLDGDDGADLDPGKQVKITQEKRTAAAKRSVKQAKEMAEELIYLNSWEEVRQLVTLLQ